MEVRAGHIPNPYALNTAYAGGQPPWDRIEDRGGR
nr:MAG TPA: hypothetical protein [Caudoviricetes sp.]